MSGKRSHGDGTLRQRENGRWESTIMIGYHPDGRRKTKSFYGKTQAEVRKKIRDYQAALERGEIAAKEYRFDEWANIWYDSHKDNIKPVTQEHYKYTLRILNSYFGHRYINDIKAMDIEVFLRKIRSDGRSDSSIAQCRGMLYMIFNKAEANDLVRKNPVRFAEKMRKRAPKRKEAFTREEVELLLEKLPENQIGWSIRLMLCTGMRTQELLGLEPRHIAEDGSTITIEQAAVMEKGSVAIGTPKSFDSYRVVPVPKGVRYCARLLRATEGKFIWEMGKPDMPCNPSTFRKKFREAIASVEGVRMLTPHSCRHTFVSQMQAIGVDLATIQSIVGHADVDMTKHYLHVQDPVRLNATQRFDDEFFKKDEEIHTNIIEFVKSS